MRAKRQAQADGVRVINDPENLPEADKNTMF